MAQHRAEARKPMRQLPMLALLLANDLTTPSWGGGRGGADTRCIPFVPPSVLALNERPALAGLQISKLQREARIAGLAFVATTTRANWRDIADRVTAILNKESRRSTTERFTASTHQGPRSILSSGSFAYQVVFLPTPNPAIAGAGP